MNHHRHKPHSPLRIRRRTAPGSAPGQVVADPQSPKSTVRAIAYGPTTFIEQEVHDLAQLDTLLGEHPVTWIHVEGLGSADRIRVLGEKFQLHPLEMEDVVNVHQRPKLEPYGDHLFIVARMVTMEEQLTTEQVSLFVGRRFVLTFVEDPGDVFEPVRTRIRTSSGRIRTMSPAYLAYALLDATIDAHFPVLETLGDRLEALEDSVLVKPSPRIVDRIHVIKRELRVLRREMWPLREVLSTLARESFEVIDEGVRIYLRDCYDHTVQILDLVELYRELGADMSDLYLSSVSNRMNEIMKVLTIMSTLFMPLSFIVGIYGMNFDTSHPLNMPELHWSYGYVMVWIWLLLTTVGMLWFFRRKGWIWSRSSTGRDLFLMVRPSVTHRPAPSSPPKSP